MLSYRADMLLMIGGGSSVGKTTVAHELGRRLGADVIDVDALPRDRAVGLDGRLSEPGIWDRPPSNLFQLLLETTRGLAPRLRATIEARSLAVEGAVVEGEGIEPRLFDAFEAGAQVRPVFVIETDPHRLRETLSHRVSRGAELFRRLTSTEQGHVVEMNVLYARWLGEEARVRGLPCVESQPWPDLGDRILAAAHAPMS